MKKTVCVILFICVLISSLSLSGYAADGTGFSEPVRTDTLLICDSATDEIIYAKNENTVRCMGSVTKVMTYILTVEACENPETEKIMIDKTKWKDMDSDASTARLNSYDGMEMSVLDLLYGLMLPSGCDAAIVLGDYIGGGTANFVKMMNEKASELGCVNTHYADTNGLSENNRTTAADTYTIFKYALSLPYFREIINTSYHYYENSVGKPVYQNNYLIDTTENGIYYYPYCKGGKTGYISEAGKCLVSLAKKGDTELICVALGGEYKSSSGYINYAMIDTRKLYEWAFQTVTENIVVNIPADYMSVQIGETKEIRYSVKANGKTEKLVWKSSDESVASVDSRGNVTALKTGMVKITAESVTGNIDEIFVSCGFYNGMLVTSRNGDFSDVTAGPIDWKAVKKSGIDYALIRSGWSYSTDASFETNVKGAVENKLDFGISFATYADNTAEAERDADYVLNLLNNNISEYRTLIKIPIVYDLVTYSANSSRDGNEMADIVNTFSRKMRDAGYDVIVYAKESTLDNLKNAENYDELPVCKVEHPWVVDFSELQTYDNGTIPYMWEYKPDGYVAGAVRDDTLHTYQHLMYMSSTYSDMFEINLDYKLEKNDGVKLTWAKTDNCIAEAEGYRIYRSGNGECEKLLDTVSSDVYSYTDSTVHGGCYTYRVVPVFTDFFDNSYETQLSTESVRVFIPFFWFAAKIIHYICNFISGLFVL